MHWTLEPRNNAGQDGVSFVGRRTVLALRRTPAHQLYVLHGPARALAVLGGRQLPLGAPDELVPHCAAHDQRRQVLWSLLDRA
jgi:hypothetical protein